MLDEKKKKNAGPRCFFFFMQAGAFLIRKKSLFTYEALIHFTESHKNTCVLVRKNTAQHKFYKLEVSTL